MKVLGVHVKLYLQGAVGIGKIAGYGNRYLLNDLFGEGILAAPAHIAGKAIGGGISIACINWKHLSGACCGRWFRTSSSVTWLAGICILCFLSVVMEWHGKHRPP